MNEYLVKMPIEKVETLEKRISELEKKQSDSVVTEPDWYDKFVNTVDKYIIRKKCLFRSEIQFLAGQITPNLNEKERGHIKTAVIMMENELESEDHSCRIMNEISRACGCRW